MVTTIKVSATNALISDDVTLVKPRQETHEVENVLLNGQWFLQVIGQPRHSFELEFIVPGDRQEEIDGYAANKTNIKLDRHGRSYTGIIRGNPEWEQVIGSTAPERARLRCRIVMLVTGG